MSDAVAQEAEYVYFLAKAIEGKLGDEDDQLLFDQISGRKRTGTCRGPNPTQSKIRVVDEESGKLLVMLTKNTLDELGFHATIAKPLQVCTKHSIVTFVPEAQWKKEN